MSFRDTKGFSLRPEAWEGPGALMNNHGLREDIAEIADILDRAFPDSPAAKRTRDLLARVDVLRAELAAEWGALGQLWSAVGWETENGVTPAEIAVRQAHLGLPAAEK